MAWPNDPELIRFVNEVLRPLCERVRALKAEVVVMQAQYATLSSMVPEDATILDDGRESEGVSRLSGQAIADVTYALVTVPLPSLNDAVLNKPCVQPFHAS
jgi:hypothetical protein